MSETGMATIGMSEARQGLEKENDDDHHENGGDVNRLLPPP